MAKQEFKPLLASGFKEIGIWQLDSLFLEPFAAQKQRKRLVDKLRLFLEEFLYLEIDSELWIDGSFATYKPDPEDIDLLFLLNRNEIDTLDEVKAGLFSRLLINREMVRSLYLLDVYFIDVGEKSEIEKWINNFGFDSKKINSKGIFKINLKTYAKL
ncbi:MAG: hypothetical protein V5804_07195 [Mucilaginibacter sp.]|uniref:DUF6932 family protein n=1 Tax=Mucilaginibacter sp. TaxID=1882438 RepID=UPI0034E461C7